MSKGSQIGVDPMTCLYCPHQWIPRKNPKQCPRCRRSLDPKVTTRKRRNIQQHGMSETPEYKAWHQMIQRCYNSNSQAWHRYGGRGIIVCDRWLRGFSHFLEDIGLKPSPELTIERIDNDGNYEPGNVKWATRWEQRFNQQGMSDPDRGIRTHATGYTAVLQIDKIRLNLGFFKTIEEARASRLEAEKKYGLHQRLLAINYFL